MKRIVLIGCLLLAGITAAVSCRKEPIASPAAEASKTPKKNPALELLTHSKMTSYVEPYCTIAGGKQCNIVGQFGCLLRFPPHSYADFEPVAVRFYEPAQTGEGETGTQLVVELLAESPLQETILGPEDSDEPVIHVYPALAHHLNCTAIEVINHVYTPAYDDEHPFGYVILDCIAHH